MSFAAVQVAVEYSVLASRDAPGGSFTDTLERITESVPTEYVAIGLGALAVLFLGKKVLDAI
jgi:hypothetical protein